MRTVQYLPTKRIIILFVFLGIIICLCYALFSYHADRVNIDVDQRILSAIDNLNSKIPSDFFDRAISADAITPQEHHKYRNLARDLCEKYKTKYLYAFIDIEGRYYMTVFNDIEPFFLEYIPNENFPELAATSKDGISRWNVSEDSYGLTKTCISRFTTPSGQNYMIGADVLVSEIANEHWFNWTSFIPTSKDFIVISLVFCAILGVVSIWLYLKKQWVLLAGAWMILLIAIGAGCRQIQEWNTAHVLAWKSSLREIKRIFAEQTQKMGHSKILAPLEEHPEGKEAYEEILESHKQWCQDMDMLLYVYTCRLIGDLSEKKLEFIISCPSDVNGDGKIDTKIEVGDPPFTPYFDDEAGTIHAWYDAYELAFQGINTMDAEIVSSLYGTFLTGAAPLYDQNGNVEAILAVDFDIEKWRNLTNATRTRSLTLVTILCFSIILIVICL
ncbi:MAG: hypothetical protein ACRC2T_11895, partial [Thermoguttaceae bacterium]